MNTKLIWGLGVAAILVGGLFLVNSYIYNEKQGDGLPTDFAEVTFWISNEPVTMVDGGAEARTDLGGDSVTTIRYFGNEVEHDLDGDGVDDVVFLVTQETGGSGTFYYAVGALKREGGYIGTHAVFLGDRIAPQTIEAGEGRQVVVNYADRAPGEPFTTPPSVGKSVHLLLDPATLQFGEVVQGFEGETGETPFSSEPVTVRGAIACLPKRGTGPQTMECAIGLRSQEGRHYGLKDLFEKDPTYSFSQTDKRVEVVGTLVQEDMRGPDGNQYDIVGVIVVDSIRELQ